MVEKFYSEQFVDIYCGHAIDILKSLPDESVQMAITSPPYWGLRNYSGGSEIVWGGNENCEHQWITRKFKQHSGRGDAQKSAKYSEQESIEDMILYDNTCSLCGAWRGQLGLEPTPELYVEHLVEIFREVKRVLRKDGSFYLNIGDTYTSGKGSCFNPGGGNKSWQSWIDRKVNYPTGRSAPNRMYQGIPPKCMTCIPERVMFSMLAAGWILRNKIIWHKPNAMPSSVKDRYTTTWEYMYFFTKARKYFFDLDAVRILHKTQSLERYQGGDAFFGHGPNPQSFNLRVRDVKRGKGDATAQDGELKASEKEIEEYEYPEKHHGSSMTNQARLHRGRQKHEFADLGAQKPARKKHSGYYSEEGEPLVDFAKSKNPGDVINSERIDVYEMDKRDKPRELRKERGLSYKEKWDNPLGKNPGDYWELTTQPYKGAHFAVFPERLCERPIKASSRIGDIVLDPFSGSGTTGVVAKRLGRKSILIDCVEEYCVISKDRIMKVEYQPGLGIKA